MNIQHHIRQLLYRNDCVIVEGFGAFVCQRQSAKMENGVFFPPRKVVNFNSGLKTDDGLLANQVALVEKVSFQIARQHIREFSERLVEKLAKDQVLKIKSLGEFKLGEENTILFQPDQSHDWLLEAYGLPSFKPAILEKEVKKTMVQEVPVVSIQNTPKTNYWRYAAVGIIAIAIAGSYGITEKIKSDVKQHNYAENQKAKAIVQETIQQSSFVINDPLRPLSVEVKVNKPKGRYHIVGGAFRIKDNAEKKITQLREQGFQAHYLGENKYGLHQVAFNSFELKSDAIKALRTIKRKNNPDAWLFVKEL